MIISRLELAVHFSAQGFRTGAEIGVADGRYAEILCQAIPGLALYCVDPWGRYANWRSETYQEAAYGRAKDRLAKYRVTLIRETSVAASLTVPGPLDFVWIDGAHDFDLVMPDIILWSEKVRPGGIVAGHDYYFFGDGGVVAAVNAYTQQHQIELNLIGRRSDGHKDDRPPCWWFVKK